MTLAPFANEPVLELRRASVRAGLADALAAVDRRLPVPVAVRVGGSDCGGAAEIVSTDPGRPSRVVAEAGRASQRDVDEAVARAVAAAPAWAGRPAGERAEILVAAAGRLRERRLELAALEVRECAKPWPEADADVCEAIDFLEYYARGALELEAGRELLQAPGERNRWRYAARGVAAVIAPWNFPIAIPAGMTAAALATGNTALLKPAEQSPGCASELVGALHTAGVPGDVLALLPGEGEAGAALVGHPGVQVIAFTGSAEVGREIVAAASAVVPGQRHLKRVVAEMGGKNCVIVDGDADLDEAVPAIVASAFAYGGQKCSAASRVLAHRAVAERLVERLGGALEAVVVGQAEELSTVVGPLIEREAAERVRRYVERAERDGRLVGSRTAVPSEGWFVAPTVVCDLPPDSPVLVEEVFGPLLTVEAVTDMSAACDVVDGLGFALTGGLFSRDPATVRAVTERTPVGNLYVNRAITGAMVGRQPFGGNRLSGTGTKAGGPDYLLSFLEPRVVTENTVRHGLTL